MARVGDQGLFQLEFGPNRSDACASQLVGLAQFSVQTGIMSCNFAISFLTEINLAPIDMDPMFTISISTFTRFGDPLLLLGALCLNPHKEEVHLQNQREGLDKINHFKNPTDFLFNFIIAINLQGDLDLQSQLPQRQQNFRE